MTDQLLRVPEVAQRLGMDGAVVYLLIADGALPAGKGADGMVYVSVDAVEAFAHQQATSAF